MKQALFLLTFYSFAAFHACMVSPCLAEEKTSAVRPPWKTSRVVGSPEPPEPYRIESVFPQLRFQKPSSIEQIPGSNRLFITEMGGKIFSFPKTAKVEQADLVADLKELLAAPWTGKNVSLLDAEFHPQFASHRYVYLCYVHPDKSIGTRVSRFTLDNETAPRIISNSERVIITWPSGGHNAGCLEFGKDGFLYISTGDGSGPNPPDGLTTGQTVTDLLGAVLRIDVNREAAGQAYSVPADNPFVKLPDAKPEIWAYGLRNPWKFGIDAETGNIFAADNGWESWEMIHRIVRGGNCGWPVMEGRAALRTEVQIGPTPILPPVKDHPHTEANSVIGGPVYRGSKLPGLAGSFVYGDYITGTIWAIRPDKDNSYSHTTLVDTDQRIVAFTETSDGELYVLDYDFTGQIYELLPSDVQDTSASFPRKLSQTGLFRSLEKMEPAPGVVPYQVKVERWMDGATAQRWVAIPDNGRIQLTVDGMSSIYPEGTVLVKHLTLPQPNSSQSLRLETQLLHLERGVWRPYSYLWDESGREATLVDSTGASRSLRLANPTTEGGFTERTWHVNAINECKLCHNAGPKFVLGFTWNQLNRETSATAVAASPSRGNQLALLHSQGVLASEPSQIEMSAKTPYDLVDPKDATQSLEDRARSYLHANCGMCHHPGGNAIVSFFLRRDLPFEKLNTNKGTGIGTFGMQDAKLIVPGDPYRSVLMYRMSKLGYARMPYIGSRVVDRAGVTLVEQWIRSLPPLDSTKLSPLALADSPPSQALESLRKLTAEQKTTAEATIGELLKSTEGALALALQIHRGAVSPITIPSAVAKGNASNSDIRGLFETFIPESMRRATLGGTIDPQIILNRTGDLERGKLIFFSDGARCRACHEIDDRSKSLGPTLQDITKKYPRLVEMLPHVLQPSQKIDDPYAAYTIVTQDGRILNGLIVSQSPTEVVLKTLEKQVVRVPRDQVEEMRKNEKSLMPDRILSDLTAQEAADLFEYIRSQTAKK